MCLFLTSGVRVLRCEMNAGTDMMWRRKDLSRLSEKCAATTGLKYTRTKSSSHYFSPQFKHIVLKHIAAFILYFTLYIEFLIVVMPRTLHTSLSRLI